MLDMGNPVKIDQLARKVIKLSGLDVVDDEGNGDIEIKYTGLRPGEKLYEELLIGDDVDGTDHKRIMKAHEDFISYEDLCIEFSKIERSLKQNDYEELLLLLKHSVSGFKHSSGIVDYLK